MIRGSCHCGAVTFELLERPKRLTDCNCSICRRIGALWAHADIDKIRISYEKGATIGYSRDDKNLVFVSCKTCGCTTHWENLKEPQNGHMAVNCRMADPKDIDGLKIRRFDGAESWQFLD